MKEDGKGYFFYVHIRLLLCEQTAFYTLEPYCLGRNMILRGFWGDFAVITRAYIHAEFEQDQERNEKRAAILEESEQLYAILSGDLTCDKEFSLDVFKSYFKAVWEYFIQYIGLFDIERKDVQIMNYLNRIDTIMYLNYISGLEVWEQNACSLFLCGLIYTLSSYDFNGYRGGFYSHGVLFISLPHQAGTSDFDEVKIDEFEDTFDRYCAYYKSIEE